MQLPLLLLLLQLQLLLLMLQLLESRQRILKVQQKPWCRSHETPPREGVLGLVYTVKCWSVN